MVSGEVVLSKIATNEGHGENSPYFDGWKAYESNPFHPVQNPDGVIQMGLAENQLCFDLISDWIKQNPEASICTPEGVDKLKDIAIFQDYHGLPEFRKAIAKFMEMARGNRVKYDPERVVMGGGATGASEIIMFCLADPGDAFLLPTPYYPAFDRDLTWRTGVKTIPVDCYSTNNFQITKQALEAAYDKAKKSGIKVKGLILANPSNPLGTTLSKTTLVDIVQFINDKNIHIVVDEIYAATIFSAPNFISISEIIEEVDCNKDLVHIIYSLSKDMGLPGFRVGIVYSYNDAVVLCARKMSSFGLVSSQTQYMLASMLSDKKFVVNFLAESTRRLKKRHGRFTDELEKVEISCLKSNAGLFVWMDLRHLMQEPTFEGEMALWRVVINEVKLNVSPGSSFHCREPGWFRVCFANMDDETVEVALKRIREFVGKRPVQMKNMNKWQKNLRLSFKDRRFEDGVISLSPHTPLPSSPLVRAK
ncbi:1-aminocyclopropane-1-carboxylate synthase 1 [Euphorbia peplus]|nr:1-aminocyclopropane-1-carboxylate synthase 1 [Euphorbia peplus]